MKMLCLLLDLSKQSIYLHMVLQQYILLNRAERKDTLI